MSLDSLLKGVWPEFIRNKSHLVKNALMVINLSDDI